MFYALHANDETEKLNFEDDLVEYLKSGFVYSSPTSFALAKVVNVASEESGLVEPAWFVRYAGGNLIEMLTRLPVHFRKIVFCRNNKGSLKQYDLAALLRITRATKGK
jgi:hypothetical protein